MEWKMCPDTQTRKTSFWRAFHVAQDERNEQGELLVVCNIFGQVLISHKSGTTNLRRHMKSYHHLLEQHNMDRDERLDNSTKKRPHSLDPTTIGSGILNRILLRTPVLVSGSNVGSLSNSSAGVLVVKSIGQWLVPSANDSVPDRIRLEEAGFDVTC